MMNLQKQTDPLKNVKENLKHKIRLIGSNQDLPLSFLVHSECHFVIVLFSDRILLYKYEDVCKEKEKVKSYISLNFVDKKSLKEIYLVFVKNSYYLLISSDVNKKVLFFYSISLDWQHNCR